MGGSPKELILVAFCPAELSSVPTGMPLSPPQESILAQTMGDGGKDSLDTENGEITAHDEVEVQGRAENPEEFVIDEPREDDVDATNEAEIPKIKRSPVAPSRQ